jgi:hypothetical protein
MQLVAYGAQDIYLTGNPQITYFKVVYRRHTNFALESIEQTFNGVGDFGRKVTALISRNGDLINRVYVQVTLPKVPGMCGSFRWVDDVGLFLIKMVEVEIGGQRIDRQFGDWMKIWNDLSLEPGLREGYRKMTGQIGNEPGELQSFDMMDKEQRILYIPLEFWFCRNYGLSLPLIALQYHEVKINVEFRQAAELYITANHPVNGLCLDAASLYVDYVYLDTDERRRFAQVSHEYLIEQLQFTGDESISNSSNKIKLSFNHPVKELIWVVQHDSFVELPGACAEGNQWANYTTELADVNESHTAPMGGRNPVNFAKLQLNGHDRFSTRAGDYFNLVQPFQHHTNVPDSPGINVYSFGIRPEEHQPSGTANFSRIDNATLQLHIVYPNTVDMCAKVRVYATNYNVLRVMSGIKEVPSELACAEQSAAY